MKACIKKSILIYALSILILSPHAYSKTLNERLGYSPDQKILILHADDLGNFDSTTRAIQDIFEHGFASSGSVITSGNEAHSVLQVLQNKVDLGIHLTFTSEFDHRPWLPAAAPHLIPSLLDSQGKIKGLLSQLWSASAAEIEIEMEAQILRGLKMGMQPSHLDSHMGGVFFKPSWFKSYLKLAKKYRMVPFVPKLAQGSEQMFGKASLILNPYLRSLLKMAEDAGYLLIDDFYLLPPPAEVVTYEGRKNQYLQLVRKLKAGVSMMIFHPTYADSDFQAGVVVHDPHQVFRQHEARILIDPEFKALLEQQGIQLISWKQIAEIYPWDEIKDIP